MIAFLAALALAPAQPALSPGLEPLRFLIGHCWRGRLPKTGEEDVHCFEPVYDGKHVRDVHEVLANETAIYRGETIYTADGAGATYTYWSSDGGILRGAMHAAPDGLDLGRSTFRGADGREIALSTFWRRIGDDSYEAVTHSADMPAMDRTTRYVRAEPPVRIADSRAPDGGHVEVHEARLAAPVDAVWAAIADAKGWATWAAPVAWDEGDVIETSYDPHAAQGGPGTIRQHILLRVEGRLLAFETVKAPQGFPHFDAYRRVRHVIELEPLGPNETRIRLVSAGYPDTPEGRQLLDFFRSGNRTVMERLQRRFRSGPIDWTHER